MDIASNVILPQHQLKGELKQKNALGDGRSMRVLQDIGNLVTERAPQGNIVAYLLISAAWVAIPMTNRMREGVHDIFTDSCASSISMEFLAFIALALSTLISGYTLTTQSQILVIVPNWYLLLLAHIRLGDVVHVHINAIKPLPLCLHHRFVSLKFSRHFSFSIGKQSHATIPDSDSQSNAKEEPPVVNFAFVHLIFTNTDRDDTCEDDAEDVWKRVGVNL
ncbi:hypothetical protein Pint_07236 [Pistacia integerrima]|uniref:Uncharacterized protein n=1 Tax=Pistacia integerrima TaxID=434235 RepID=A0ACC0XV87_9ROSI|nr:hypothetical protein Pint_07236 [Pistacia integerrima]